MKKPDSFTFQIGKQGIIRDLNAFIVVSSDFERRCAEYLKTQSDGYFVSEKFPGEPSWQHRDEIHRYCNPVRKQQLREQIKYLRRKLSELSKSIDAFPEIRL